MTRERRLCWAELLKRTSAVDVLRWARCGGHRTLISLVGDPTAVAAILGHLGLVDGPRGPPQVRQGLT